MGTVGPRNSSLSVPASTHSSTYVKPMREENPSRDVIMSN